MEQPLTIDQKREEFRGFLEKQGVTALLTKLLVSLYEEPERPKDPILYLRNKLDASLGKLQDVERQQEIDTLSKQVERLEVALAEKIGADEALKIKEGINTAHEVAEEATETDTPRTGDETENKQSAEQAENNSAADGTGEINQIEKNEGEE
ncbi:unnamed protein product [Cyprideis torosa]|uniref:Uncharacterized protein n=1 Tax=Cyprideis torosa TaxID=163714 RepID=A0A7R8ZIG8_9CRUS|nr:unnamed protein product [Cyprideis torosa]CAG0886108.1 unnamed protein product [Cyprideis torosa]